MANFADLSFEDILSYLKPINSLTLLWKVLHSEGISQAAAHCVALLELHGLYWEFQPEQLLHIVDVVRKFFSRITNFEEIFAPLSALGFAKADKVESQAIEIETGGVLQSLKDFLASIGVTGSLLDGIPVAAALAACGGIALTILTCGTTLVKCAFGGGVALFVHSLASSIKDWNVIFSSVKDMWKVLANHIGKFLGFTWSDEKTATRQALLKRVEEVTDVVTSLETETELNFSKMLRQADYFRKITDTLRDVDRLVTTVCEADINTAPFKISIDDLKSRVRTQEARYKVLRSSVVGKQQPTVIYLFGHPGVGKSTLANHLVDVLSTQETRPLTVYARNSKEKHWDGYAGQDVVIYDDFGGVLNGTDHDELQLIYSPSAMGVPMAFDKGMQFCSRYVIVCSNIDYWVHSATLASPESLNRRRDFFFRVESNLNQGPTSKEQALGHLTLTALDRAPGFPAVGPNYMAIADARQAFGFNALGRVLFNHQEINYRAFQAELTRRLATVNPQAQAAALERQDLDRKTMYLLRGPPGVSKTTVAKRHRTDSTQDDFLLTPEGKNWVLKVMTQYDTPNDEVVVLTTNIDVYEKYWAKRNEERQAFERRLTVVDFHFRKKKLVSRYTLSELQADFDHYSKYVTVAIDGDPISISTLDDRIEGTRAKHVDIVYSHVDVPRITLADQDRYGTIRIPTDWASAPDCNPLSFEFTNCSAIKLAATLLPVVKNLARDRYGTAGTFEGALKKVNSDHIKLSEPIDLLLLFDDATCYVTTDHEDNVVCCLIDALVKYTFDDATSTVTCHINDVVDFQVSDCYVYQWYKSISTAHVPTPFQIPVVEVPGVNRIFSTIFTFVKLGVGAFSIYQMCKAPEQPVIPSEGMRLADAYGLDAKRKNPLSVVKESDTSTEGSVINPREVHKHPDVRWEKPEWMKALEKDRIATHDWVKDWVASGRELWGDSEACIDEAADQLVTILMNQNFPVVRNGKVICNAQMIYGRVGVTVGHCAREDLFLDIKGKLYPMIGLRVDTHRDIYIFRLEGCEQFRDVRRHLPLRSSTYSLSGYPATVNLRRGPNQFKSMPISLRAIAEPITDTGMHKAIAFCVSAYGEVSPLQTIKGDCGSPVVVVNQSVTHKFLGVHIAGSTCAGYCSILFVEDFIESQCDTGEVEPITVKSWQHVVPPEGSFAYPGAEHFKVVGRAGVFTPRSIVYHDNKRPTQTRIYSSPLAMPTLFPEKYEPAVLHHLDPRLERGDDFSVYRNAMNKWSRVQQPYDTVLWGECVDAVAEFVSDVAKGQNLPIRVLTKKECVNSYSLVPESSPMYRGSSPGYPYTFVPGLAGKKKAEFFTWNETEKIWCIKQDAIGRLLHHDVDSFLQSVKAGERTAVVFSGTLKDEALKIAKIASGKTRAFAACPTYFTMAHRMFFHAGASVLVHAFREWPGKVGISPTTHDFHELYQYLARCGDFGFDGDFSDWDASVNRNWMRDCCTVWNRIYEKCDPKCTPLEQHMRTRIYEHLVGPLLLYHDFVVQSPGGQVSGQPATAIDNCFINMFLYLYVWMTLARRHAPKYARVSEFWRCVAFAVYGDDNVCTILPEVRTWFNFENFQAEAGKLGMIMTPADKQSATGERKLNTMEFLKRNFVKLNGYWVGRLLPGSMSKLLSWTTMTKRHVYVRGEPAAFCPQTIVDSARSALIEASLYGKDVYVQVKTHIINVAQQNSIMLPFFPPWSTMFAEVYWGVASESLTSACAFKTSVPMFLKHQPSQRSKKKDKMGAAMKTPASEAEIEAFERLVKMAVSPGVALSDNTTNEISELAAKVYPVGCGGKIVKCDICGRTGCDCLTPVSQSDNGGNNPPMPSGGGSTGTVFTGTDATPIPLSQIAVAPAPTLAEAAPHAGVTNAIDPYFYNQFVGLTNFTWTTSQVPGTLLWSTPITPKRGHANLAYLAGMYNIWVGGLEYQIKVAGTGFHAGSLAIVRLPPNVNPGKLVGTNMFTMFEYTIIDPKTLDAVMKSACDQRPLMYHYMDYDGNDPDTFGGHLAIYVIMQLNTSSSGSNQIDIQVFNRCAPDFSLLQMVPVNLASVPDTIDISRLFSNKREHLNPYNGIVTEKIVIMPKSIPSSKTTHGVWSLIDKWWYDGCESLWMTALNSNGQMFNIECTDISTPATPKFQFRTRMDQPLPTGLFVGVSSVPAGFMIKKGDDEAANIVFVAGDTSAPIAITWPTGYAAPAVGDDFTLYPILASSHLSPLDFAKAWTPPVSESLLEFQNSNRFQTSATSHNDQVRNSATTTHIAEEFATGLLQISSGQAVLAAIIDGQTDLPLMYCKLYKEGFFTAALRDNELAINFEYLRLEFVGWIRETDPVPGPNMQMKELLLKHELISLSQTLSKLKH